MAEHFLEEEFPTKEEREKIETTLENAKQLLEISEDKIELDEAINEITRSSKKLAFYIALRPMGDM